jgi:hypothetical protein
VPTRSTHKMLLFLLSFPYFMIAHCPRRPGSSKHATVSSLEPAKPVIILPADDINLRFMGPKR